jgi:perosamine synthetase
MITLCRTTIPWWQPEVGQAEYDLLRQVLDSNFLNEGRFTEQFASRLADLLGVKHAIAATSCTAALFLALKALDVGHGDEVIVPDVTFIATANAVTLTGARPVLVDIDPQTLTIDPQQVEAAITPRTRAIVPVHLSGRAADMTALCDLARHRGLEVVEDAAEALLSYHQGRPLGTWGKLGCFSFSPNKTLTTGQGGLIVTNDDRLVVRLREFKDQGRPVRGTGGDDLHHSIGFNFKFTNLQAALGLGQLELLPARLERMRRTYEIYWRELTGLPGFHLPGFRPGEVPQWVDAVVTHRDALAARLTSLHMHTRNFWHPIHRQVPYHLPDTRFPNSTDICRKALWLPSAFTLSDEDLASVCRAIREFAYEH